MNMLLRLPHRCISPCAVGVVVVAALQLIHVDIHVRVAARIQQKYFIATNGPIYQMYIVKYPTPSIRWLSVQHKYTHTF